MDLNFFTKLFIGDTTNTKEEENEEEALETAGRNPLAEEESVQEDDTSGD